MIKLNFVKILTIPHPILTQKAKPVKKIDKKIEYLVKHMSELLNQQTDPPGVGLAAPQVGKNLSLFIIKPTKKAKPTVFINPIIKKTVFVKDSFEKNKAKKNKKTAIEGCLSIPKIWGVVRRANKVLVEYQDLSGEKKIKWFSGFEAVIIQHEIDHLNGILFTKRVIENNLPLYEEKEGKLRKINLSF